MRWILIQVGFQGFLVGAAACGAESTNLGHGKYSIECRRSAGNCYEEAAQVCPDGFDVLNAGSRSGAYAVANTIGTTTTVTAVPIYHGDMLVECKRKAEAEQERGDDRQPPSSLSRRPESKRDHAPTIAAGFRFGSTPAAFAAACEAAGNQATTEPTTVACTGTVAPLRPPATSLGRFCDGSLCSLHLLQGPWPKPGAALTTLQEAKGRLTEHYGLPTTKSTVIPSECEEDLAACLADGRSTVFYDWRFRAGFSVNVTLLVIGDQVAVGILYATPDGLRATRTQGL